MNDDDDRRDYGDCDGSAWLMPGQVVILLQVVVRDVERSLGRPLAAEEIERAFLSLGYEVLAVSRERLRS